MELTSRRQFVGHLTKGAAVILLSRGGTIAIITAEGVLLGGCNLYDDILNWVPVGEASLNSILTVLSSNGVVISPAIQGVVATIEAAFTALSAAVSEYKSTTPPPTGAISKIQTAFTDIVDNFSTFLKSLSISSSLVGVVVGIAQIIFSTIAAFSNKLPAVTTLKMATVLRTMQVGSQTVPIVPKVRTRRAFKKDINSVLNTAKSQGVTVPPVAYMKLSLFEHF